MMRFGVRIAATALAACVGPLGFSAAHAGTIGLSGVFGGRAVIVSGDNTLHTLRVGQTTPDGIRLLSVESDSAVVEVDGVRQKLELGERVINAGSEGSDLRVVIEGDSRGHFVVLGSVNGAAMRFLVDTGATAVSMGAADARRAGIDYRQGRRGQSQTANGVVPIWIVKLSSIRIGVVELTGVDAVVHESEMPFALLGMSFLNRMQIIRDGNRLVLERRY
ncbi:Clan AA aspartic protease [Thauera humireducens]|uniref:TIGR02281 family clan AA aspartic protease n=1 Tax=Thauera humireducens TaxID=1134435 RepID=UPI002467A93D|nr:TIGR02281 family clan AA aspartic protease [Thauera humireducens]CAH1748591.1 Clan AA aspartic protease [Thauera humireducens]